MDDEDLKRVAEDATPGPWQNGIDDLEGIVAPYQPGLGNVICIPPEPCMYSSRDNWDANATFIATFDPPTILALLNRLSTAATRERELVDAIAEACSLLMEATYGNPARSPAHNARLKLEAALAKHLEALTNEPTQ